MSFAFDLMVSGQLRYRRITTLGHQTREGLGTIAIPLTAFSVLIALWVGVTFWADEKLRMKRKSC